VRALNKWSGEGGIRNVRDAFSQRDWNTIKTEEGLKEFGVECVLAEHIDAEAAPALEATREHQFPLSRPDREALAMFMSTQLSRGRAVRKGLAGSIVEVNRRLLRLGAVNYSNERLREITGQEPSAELREMMANSEKYLEIQPTNAMLLQAMFSSVQEIAEIVDRRTWTLVRFDSPCLFTGEHPFVHINPSGESFGFGVATAEQGSPRIPRATTLNQRPRIRAKSAPVQARNVRFQAVNSGFVASHNPSVQRAESRSTVQKRLRKAKIRRPTNGAIFRAWVFETVNLAPQLAPLPARVLLRTSPPLSGR
jgi:Protein of unknown function (DUF4238)